MRITIDIFLYLSFSNLSPWVYICSPALYRCCGALIHWLRLALRGALAWAFDHLLLYYLVGRSQEAPEDYGFFSRLFDVGANSNNRAWEKGAMGMVLMLDELDEMVIVV
jgi:hypothetical protein